MNEITTFWTVFYATGLAALVTYFGIYIVNRYSEWGKKNTIYFIKFASGVLITISFSHLVPESFEKTGNASLFLLIGFWFLHFADHFINFMFRHKKNCEECSLGIIFLIAISLHSFIDGIIFTVTFNVSMYTGFLTAIGMVLHEFPEGIIVYLLLLKSGYTKKHSAVYAFIAAGLTTPLGAIISFPVIEKLTPEILGQLLSFSAGALIYVGSTHLLPQVDDNGRKFTSIALILGIGVALAMVNLGHN